MQQVSEYARRMATAVARRDDQEVGKLLDHRSLHYARVREALSGANEAAVERAVQQCFGRGSTSSAWAGIAGHCLRAAMHEAAGTPPDVYAELERGFKTFILSVFEAPAWNRTLQTLIRRLRVAAQLADAEGNKQADFNSKFTQCFREMVVKILDNSDKKFGALYLVCALFQTFLQLKNVTLCNDLMRFLRARNLPPVEEFSVSQRVMYLYYRGRLALFEAKFGDAAQFLQDAFELCSKQYRRNKRLILWFLVPAKLLVGSMPSGRLLDKYDMHAYKELCEATRAGNVSGFQQCLAQHRGTFIRLGIYLTLEKLQMLVYRNLFRATYTITGKTKIPLAMLRTSLATAGRELEPLEVECILATLIFRRLVKGYIHHERQVLVLASKGEPFPPLHAALSSD